MKYNTKTTLTEHINKKAVLRLINDIAVVDVELAATLRPNIIRFAESISQQSSASSDDILNKLSDFFKIQSTTDKAEWLRQNKDVADTVKTIMDSKQDEADDFVPGLDAPDSTAPGLEPGLDGNEPAGNTDFKSVATDADNNSDDAMSLDKIRLETRLRAYIEEQLTEFLADRVNASVVAQNVENYDSAYARRNYDDSIDTAFEKVLTVLISTLLANY